MPTIEELTIAYKKALEYYYTRFVDMKKQAMLDINTLRRLGKSFQERKFYMDKCNWVDKQIAIIRGIKYMPEVSRWVDEFPVGEWATNNKSKEENYYEFVIKSFELGRLSIVPDQERGPVKECCLVAGKTTIHFKDYRHIAV